MSILEQLEKDGVAILPNFIQGETLANMQRAFEAQLQRLRWNNFDGYEKTERFRHMVENVLTLEQGFVDVAIHPLVKETLQGYIGEKYELVEAKGWKSIPTRRRFHSWHADAWYDQNKVSEIPREVKLAFYLTDVDTGCFSYIKGTHRKNHPRGWRNQEIEALPESQIVKVPGPAGTGFLFDTSGVHGQSWPILERRNAVFYNYHDPSVPLQPEDIEYYRYHPLLLNAAFLGNLTPEDRRILGFGNKTNYIPGFTRKPKHKTFQALHQRVFDTKVLAEEFSSRVGARLNKLIGAK
jgi:Phytanoyl-CoA dioxygenase (PhyH)